VFGKLFVIISVVREISKGINSATMAVYKKILRVTKSLLDFESFGLKMELKADEKYMDLFVYSAS